MGRRMSMRHRPQLQTRGGLRSLSRRGSPWRTLRAQGPLPVIRVLTDCGARMRAPYGTSPPVVPVPEKMQVKMRKQEPENSGPAYIFKSPGSIHFQITGDINIRPSPCRLFPQEKHCR